MLVVLSDTHSETGHELAPAIREHVASADRLLHAGDFTSEAALAAFQAVAPRLEAVHGNADDPAVRERLAATRTVEYGDLRILLTHAVDGGRTAGIMAGRQRDADLVVVGHTHVPTLETGGRPALLNPGSHASPRGNRPGYATIDGASPYRLQLRRPDGSVVQAGRLEE